MSLITPPVVRLALVCAGSIILSQPLAAQCSFSISPSSGTFSATGGTGQVAISASASNCARAVMSNVPWIAISFGQAGTGNGSAGYTVLPNPTPAQRTGAINVAGQTFTVTQAAANCTYSVSPTAVTVSSSGESGSFQVISNCTWTATTNAPWITVVGGAGTGDGTVGYVAAASTGQRTATINVGTATFTITQSAPCNFTFAMSGARITAAGGSFTIQVTASNNNCERNVTSTVPWITIGSGGNGSGSGPIGYTVATNTSAQSRLGTIRVDEQTFVINQDASTCLYTLTPAQQTLAVNGGSGTFTVTTTPSCPWVAESTANWVLLTPGASGTGTGTVTFGVAANLLSESRTAAITVANTAFLVSQPAAGCEIAIDPTSATLPTNGGTGTVQVIAPSACTWTATKTVDWISLTGPVSGAGDGVIRYAATANTGLQIRRANISIAGRIFELAQSPANCNVSVDSTPITIPAGGGSGRLTVSANCPWQATASASWIQFTSAASGASDSTLTFLVQANTSPALRTANIVVNGQTVAITQHSQTCTLTLSPTNLTIPPEGGTSIANVTASTSCDWTATSSEAWMEVTWARANASGSVMVDVQPNTSGTERSGVILVSGNPITVRQLSIVLSSSGMLNAATFTAGPVAPGEIVTVYGSRIGPRALVQFRPGTTQPFPATLGNTRLLFDGVAAPMIYTSDNQLSGIVPYSIADRTLTRVQVEYLGALSNTIAVPVAPASPGIFTLDMSGMGAGAILNQDFTLNSVETPAARGSVVQIFATGEGQTRPAGIDGKLAAPPLPIPLLQVTVTIGGRPATVTYAGAAPGLVAGLMQINARIAEDITPGPAVPIVIRIGEFSSRDGVTLSVR